MSEDRFIETLRKSIEQSLNWGTSESWTDYDFENLSEAIFRKTQVKLSISTLKRIWGKVRYESSPSLSTLNVLAMFSGFENWRAFQQSHREPPTPAIDSPKVAIKGNLQTWRSNWLRIGLFLLVCMVSLSAFLLVRKKRELQEDPVTVKFESRKVSDDLPNSVVFTYDASAFQSQNVFIQQSWDPQRRERVSPTGKQHTSIYYHPGYFHAKLIVDDKVRKEDIVFIKTKGWKGIINLKPIPIYLSKGEIVQHGAMGINNLTLKEKINSGIFNDVWVKFSNLREFDGLKSNDFVLETTVRNTSTPEECICRKVKIVVLGTEGAIIIPLGVKGCSASFDLLTGDEFLAGSEHDLSALGCDFASYETVRCSAKDGHLKIALNNKQVFDFQQKSDVGNIVGIRFEFEGAGEVKEVRLSKANQVMLDDRF